MLVGAALTGWRAYAGGVAFFTFEGHLATSVEFVGDDPPVFYALFLWIWACQGDLFENECAGMFEGGTTPAECARGFAKAAKDFVAWSPFH